MICVAVRRPDGRVMYLQPGDDAELTRAAFTEALTRARLGELAGRPGGWEQALELARADWTERLHPRGAHGKFARKPGGTATPADMLFHGMNVSGGEGYTLMGSRINAEWKKARDRDIARELGHATAAFAAQAYLTAAAKLRKAAQLASDRGHDGAAARYDAMAARIEADTGETAQLRDSVAGFTRHGAAAVPGLLGGGRQTWDGSVSVVPELSSPGVLAQLDWDAHMTMIDSVAKGIQNGLSSTGEVQAPDAFSVPLHELIHGVVAHDAESYSEHQDAYQEPNAAAIEEGFTELGTIQHAPEFFDAAGIGDRPTSVYEITTGHDTKNPNYLKLRKRLADRLRGERDTLEKQIASGVYGLMSGKHGASQALLLDEAAKAVERDDYAAAHKALSKAFLQADSKLAGDIITGFIQKVEDTDASYPHPVDNPARARQREHLAVQLEQVRAELKAELGGPHDRGTWQQAIDRVDQAIAGLRSADAGGLVPDVSHTLRRLGTPANKARADLVDAEVQKLLDTPELKHATMAGYARRLQARQRIIDGDAWGHYPVQTKLALEWAEEVAMAERQGGLRGKALDVRVNELADEVNRQGPAGKVGVMAGQVGRALGWELSGMSSGDLAAIEHEIRSRWLEQGSIIAFEYAKGVARARAEMNERAAKYRRERVPA